MLAESHACFHKPSTTQKFATISARVQASFAPGIPSSSAISCSSTQHSQKGYVASAKQTKDRQVTVGVHFCLEEFLTKAIRLCHPTEHSSLFPKEVRANKAHLSSKTIHQVAKERTEEVRRWVTLLTELAAKEKELKASLAPE